MIIGHYNLSMEGHLKLRFQSVRLHLIPKCIFKKVQFNCKMTDPKTLGDKNVIYHELTGWRWKNVIIHDFILQGDVE